MSMTNLERQRYLWGFLDKDHERRARANPTELEAQILALEEREVARRREQEEYKRSHYRSSAEQGRRDRNPSVWFVPFRAHLDSGTESQMRGRSGGEFGNYLIELRRNERSMWPHLDAHDRDRLGPTYISLDDQRRERNLKEGLYSRANRQEWERRQAEKEAARQAIADATFWEKARDSFPFWFPLLLLAYFLITEFLL